MTDWCSIHPGKNVSNSSERVNESMNHLGKFSSGEVPGIPW
jgi:hypothetical protein